MLKIFLKDKGNKHTSHRRGGTTFPFCFEKSILWVVEVILSCQERLVEKELLSLKTVT